MVQDSQDFHHNLNIVFFKSPKKIIHGCCIVPTLSSKKQLIYYIYLLITLLTHKGRKNSPSNLKGNYVNECVNLKGTFEKMIQLKQILNI